MHAILHPNRTMPARERFFAAQPKVTHSDSLMCWALVVTSLAPYMAINIGSNTNLPVSSIVALYFVSEVLRRPVLAVTVVAMLLTPSFAAFVGILAGMSPTNAIAIFVWIGHVMPLIGFAGAVLKTGATLIPALRLGIIVTSVLAIVQKFLFLDRGTLPFVELYGASGYASVRANADIIVNYIRRPFAQFPEPSFMAGTLVLATSALLLMVALRGFPLRGIDHITIGLACASIFLSNSGSGVVTIGLLLLATYWRAFRGLSRWISVTFGLAAASIIAIQVLTARSTSRNSSWSDRITSIEASFRYFASSETAFFTGFGKGATSQLFASNAISTAGLQSSNATPDIFSVLGRVILESGLVFGGSMVVVLVGCILVTSRQLIGTLPAVCITAIYLTVSVLTISYDSAAWLWALPGIALGARVLHKESHPEQRTIGAVR